LNSVELNRGSIPSFVTRKAWIKVHAISDTTFLPVCWGSAFLRAAKHPVVQTDLGEVNCKLCLKILCRKQLEN